MVLLLVLVLSINHIAEANIFYRNLRFPRTFDDGDNPYSPHFVPDTGGHRFSERFFHPFRSYPTFNSYLYHIRSTQPWLKTPTTNKEYGNKLAKAEIIPKKFFLSDDELPWPEALSACQSADMILASPQNMAQMHKLQEYLRVNDLIPTTVTTGYWVGGRRDALTIEYLWGFNGKIIEDDMWLPGEPNSFNGEDCVEIQKAYSQTMKFNNYYCDMRRKYICEQLNSEEFLKNKVDSQESNRTQEAHHELNKLTVGGAISGTFKESLSAVTTTTITSVTQNVAKSTKIPQPTTSTLKPSPQPTTSTEASSPANDYVMYYGQFNSDDAAFNDYDYI